MSLDIQMDGADVVHIISSLAFAMVLLVILLLNSPSCTEPGAPVPSPAMEIK